MLFPETRVLSGNDVRLVKDIRENSIIAGASGWSDVGDTRVSDVYVEFDHRGPLYTLTTSRGAILRCSPEQICFGRLNPLSRHYQLYLMERSTMGFRVGMSQELMRELVALQNLKNDQPNTEIIDRVWIMDSTENLPRAVFLEKLSMFKYGIPNLPFSGKQAIAELSDEMIKELFNRIDTPTRGRQMLQDANMFEDYPHITLRLAQAGAQGSNAIQFVLFGGTEKAKNKAGFSHLIRIDSAIELNRSEHKQFKRRMGTHGLWHLEVTRDDLDEAQLFVKTLSCLDNLQVIKKIQLTKKSPFYLLPASHLRIGMIVPIVGQRGIEEDIVTSISVADYQGPLYNFKVERLYNFLAGEWVVMSFHDKPKIELPQVAK